MSGSGLTRCQWIGAGALTPGSGKLAVDGVLPIGEHGDCRDNGKGQKLYPPCEFSRAYRGGNPWGALGNGAWPQALQGAVLCRSHQSKTSHHGFNSDFASHDALRRMPKDQYAYVVEHTDGVRSAIVALRGVVTCCCFAARIDGRKEPLSTQMYLPIPPAHTALADCFSTQVNNIERMFLTGVTAAGGESRYQREKPILTPTLKRWSARRRRNPLR